MSWHPPEIIISLGSFDVRTYGLILALAILIAFSWAEYRAKKFGLDKRLASDVFFWAIIGAVIGARLGFAIQEVSYYHLHPAEILAIRAGGLSFHGGLVGALISGLIILKKRRALNQFWLFADAAAAPLLLGVAIGRLGNWANQELYGYPTTVPWSITIDPAHRLPGFENFASFHPTFAYEMLVNFLGLVLLIFVFEKIRDQKKEIRNQDIDKVVPNRLSLIADRWQIGTSFLFALAWYSLARGLTEIWRIGDRLLGPLSLAQVISLIMVGIALFLFHKRCANICTISSRILKSK